MALVVRASGGGSGGVRLIFSALLRRLLGMRSRRIATSSPSGSPSSDEDDDTSPLIKQIPRNISSVSNFLSLDGRDSGSAHMAGAMPLPFGHHDWPAHQLFDARTARPESAKQDVEMVTSTRQVTRLLREHEHVMPPVALVNTTPGQPPILRIPLTDRLVASFLAQAVGVQVDATDGVNMTANRAVIPPSSDSKDLYLHSFSSTTRYCVSYLEIVPLIFTSGNIWSYGATGSGPPDQPHGHARLGDHGAFCRHFEVDDAVWIVP